MDLNQIQFLEVLLSSGALNFGSFLTKSGRSSPFFFNMGKISTGNDLRVFVDRLLNLISLHFPDVTVLFGPAYKGIPLCAAAAVRFSDVFGKDVGFAFNRKEVKDHGEGGLLIGRTIQPGDKVVIVEDVLTGGTSLRESISLLDRCGAKIVGAAVGIDRQEKGITQRSAREEIEGEFKFPVKSILKIEEIISHLTHHSVLSRHWLDAAQLDAIATYRQQFGAP